MFEKYIQCVPDWIPYRILRNSWHIKIENAGFSFFARPALRDVGILLPVETNNVEAHVLVYINLRYTIHTGTPRTITLPWATLLPLSLTGKEFVESFSESRTKRTKTLYYNMSADPPQTLRLAGFAFRKPYRAPAGRLCRTNLSIISQFTNIYLTFQIIFNLLRHSLRHSDKLSRNFNKGNIPS